MIRVIGFFGVVLMLLAGTLVYARRDEPEQWIAFISDRDGNAEIYRMRPDGSDVQQLTQTPDDIVHCWIRWSANGGWLNFAYGRLNLTYTGPFGCNYSHGAPTHSRMKKDDLRVQNVVSDYYFSDSPNGTWLLVPIWDSTSQQWTMFRTKPNGESMRFLYKSRDASWSPDGRWILISGNTYSGEDNNLYVMPSEETHLRRLAIEHFYFTDGTAFLWAGDGENILFYGNPKSSDRTAGLYQIGVESQRIQLISDSMEPIVKGWSQVTLSPDGNWLGFISMSNHVSVINLTSRESEELVHFDLPEAADAYESGAISWSPDSQWIVFSKFDEAGRSRIWRIHPDGTGLEQLTFGLGEDLRPAWSPVMDKAWDGWGLMGLAAGLVTIMWLMVRWRE